MQQNRHAAAHRTARPSVRVATIAMMLGLAVMFITISVVLGFKHEISRKVIGFGSHIQIVNYENQSSYEMQPIRISDHEVQLLRAIDDVRSVLPFATKPGIVKTDSAFHGVVFKGVPIAYDWTFFRENMVDGRVPALSDTILSNEVIISKELAQMLQLHLGDRFLCYFVDDRINARRMEICGIYDTNFSDFDQMFLIGDLKQVQRLNQWDSTQYSGLEVYVNDFDHVDETAMEMYNTIGTRFDDQGNAYHIQTIQELYPQIFSWLALLNMDVWVIIILMLIVSGFCIISGLIILVLDNTRFIGIFKSIGAGNRQIRKIFIWQAMMIVIRGMAWGNLIGFAACYAQQRWHLIPLDPTAYYVNHVPIEMDAIVLLLLNAGTLLLTLLMLIGPTHLIARISPARVIKFE